MLTHAVKILNAVTHDIHIKDQKADWEQRKKKDISKMLVILVILSMEMWKIIDVFSKDSHSCLYKGVLVFFGLAMEEKGERKMDQYKRRL